MLGLERPLQSNYYPASEITPSATYFPIRPAHSTRWPLLLCPFPSSIFLHLPIDFLFADCLAGPEPYSSSGPIRSRHRHLRWAGRHQLIESILGEAVHKGDDGAAAFDQPAPGVHVGDIGELIVGDIQQLGQLRPVGGSLVEHNQELAVGQHGAGGVGLEQVVG